MPTQFKRARHELKFLRTRFGRIIRDVRRKIEGNTALEDRFGPLLDLTLRVRHQEQRGDATAIDPICHLAPDHARVAELAAVRTEAPYVYRRMGSRQHADVLERGEELR